MNSIHKILFLIVITSFLVLLLLDPLSFTFIISTPHVLVHNFFNFISEGTYGCWNKPNGLINGIHLFNGEGEMILDNYDNCIGDPCCKFVLFSSSSFYLCAVLFTPFVILLALWKLVKDCLKKQ